MSTFTVLAPSAYTPVDLRPACQLDITWQTAQTRWSIPFLDSNDELGRIKVALIRSAGGEQVVLVAYRDAPKSTRDLVTIEARYPMDRSVVAELDALLEELGLASAEVQWFGPRVELERWTVMRQDDLGNRTAVTTCPGRYAAAAAMRELEANPHKQMYWLERSDDRPW